MPLTGVDLAKLHFSKALRTATLSDGSAPKVEQVINYGRLLCAFLSVAVTLMALYWQFMFVGLMASAAVEFPATHGIQAVMLVGGPTLAIIFLICLFGGVKWSVLATGWMLVWQILLCVLVLLTLCDVVTGRFLAVTSPLNRFPDALGVALGCVALALSLVLFRARRWGGSR